MPKITSGLPVRRYGRLKESEGHRGLLSLRLDFYCDFLERCIARSLREKADISGDGPWRCSLKLDSPRLESSERSPAECVAGGLTYDARLTVRTALTDQDSGEVVEQRLMLCRVPLMDPSGGFVINGVRRTVLHTRFSNTEEA